MLIISCTRKENSTYTTNDGVRVINNSSTPANPEFNYVFKEEASIPFKVGEENPERNFTRPQFVITDKPGNIYIAGGQVAKIFKFDKNYEFVKSFGGKGGGPGEFSGGPSSLTIFQNKILAPCWRTTLTNVYDTDGNFIKQIPPKIRSGFSGQLVFNNQLLMNREERKPAKSEVSVTTSIVAVDENISKVTTTIYQKETLSKQRTFRISDMYVRFAAGNELLYVADVSDKEYKIFGYDTGFNKVLEIRKRFKAEIEEGDSAYVYMFGKQGSGGSFYRKEDTPLKNRDIYYKAINHLFVDENNRLWVVSPTKNKGNKDGLFVDIFEDGTYLNTIQLPFYKAKMFSFVYPSIFMRRSKLFYVDKESEVIRVYSYK